MQGRRRLADSRVRRSGYKAWAIRPVRDRVRQGAHHRLLPDQLGEGRGPIFAERGRGMPPPISLILATIVETRETGRTTQIGALYYGLASFRT